MVNFRVQNVTHWCGNHRVLLNGMLPWTRCLLELQAHAQSNAIRMAQCTMQPQMHVHRIKTLQFVTATGSAAVMNCACVACCQAIAALLHSAVCRAGACAMLLRSHCVVVPVQLVWAVQTGWRQVCLVMLCSGQLAWTGLLAQYGCCGLGCAN